MGRRRPWPHRRLRQIAEALGQLGLWICPNTVRQLLDQLGFALHANRKTLAGVSSPQRDRQFRYLGRQRRRFARHGWPVISVDSKKKELVGRFKNSGRVWSRKATPVNDHDFRSQAQGLDTPYGVYDTQANQGSVFVGTSHDTPQFAAEAISQWWHREGRRRYPHATQLLILADSGGSNGYRCRAWKWALQKQLVDRYQLRVTVGHYPPGASKWNPIEHRLFSEISKHWAGKPLDSHSTMLKEIRETRTRTGLKVKSYLVTKQYPSGVKISDEMMRQVRIQMHTAMPQWNYTLVPNKNRH
jgi:hypothetical protein